MSSEELERALKGSRVKNAEKTIVEMIGQLLDLSPEAVARVVLAYQNARTHKIDRHHDDKQDDVWDGLAVPHDVEQALQANVRWGVYRVAARWHLEHDYNVEVPFQKLVPKDKPEGMCAGCVHQFECVRDMLSTPDRCWDNRSVYRKDPDEKGRPQSLLVNNQWASCVPLRLDGNMLTIRCDRPRGEFKVHVTDVRL